MNKITELKERIRLCEQVLEDWTELFGDEKDTRLRIYGEIEEINDELIDLHQRYNANLTEEEYLIKGEEDFGLWLRRY